MLARAIELRMAGERFAVRLAFGDVRLVGFLRSAAEAYALPPAERDARFAQLAKLEGIRDEKGERIRRLPADIARARGYAAIAALAETAIVPYDTQRMYIATAAVDPVSSRDVRTELVAPEPSATVPHAIERSAQPDAIVVWCGNEPASVASVIVHALANCGMPVVVVARDAIAGADVHATFVDLAAGAVALGRARVIVPADSGDAVALARLGVPMAVRWVAGAGEYVTAASAFRAWVERDVLPAVSAALAAPPPATTNAPQPMPPLEAIPAHGPPVALRIGVEIGEPIAEATAQSVAAQQYVDVISSNASDTVYDVTVPNGAIVFPDHVARLVAVAERSGAARVFASALDFTTGEGVTVEGDAFRLERRGATRGGVARVAVATGLWRA
jgi:hypothetical protein